MNPAFDIDLEVLGLIQQRPAFCGFEKTITDRLLECGQDRHWRRLVLNQLRLNKSPSTKSAAQRELDLLPPTTSKEIFARILARVPSQGRTWARKALSWTLYTFRPLTVWELGVALALETDSLPDETMNLDELVYQHVIADLDEILGGMFIVRHNEVHFCHPDAREYLLAADGDQEHVWYDVKEIAHQHITDACLSYLSLQQVQDAIAMSYSNPPADPPGWPTFIPRNSLRDYAVKYWPRHYERVPATFRPTKRALEFVQNTKAMRYWTEAYWWVSNPVSRTDRAFLSLLPIFAGLGLQDLVTEWLDLNVETPEASQDCPLALALAEAARNAHVEVVRKLLPYAGYNQASLQDALVAGASCCNEAVLDELVTYVAKSMKNFDWPPAILCRAAQFGLENMVKKLLESGASLDTAITVHDLTPLHLTARHGHVGIVKVLLDHKASLTKLALYGRVPLHTASAYGHAAIVKLLVDAGAEVNVVDAEKMNAMEFACLNGNYKAVEILAEAGCDMGCNQQGNWPPLMVVAAEGLIKSARLLLEKKADTEIEGWSNWTPLRRAALNGHVELCRLLLENGANPNTLKGGAPILGESAATGNLEIVKLLVENGAVVDAVDPQGWTALQKASARGHLSVATYLLDHGADVSHTNEIGESSIFLAAWYSSAALVQLLIDRGADLHLATSDDRMPVYVAYDDAETTRVLMKNGAKINRVVNGYSPLYLAASENHIEVVKVLLSFNPDLENRHDEGYSALAIATFKGHIDIVRLLLEAGANVNQRSDRNNFPLQYAVSNNREDVVRTLMEYRPDLDLVDDDGDTALNCIFPRTSLAVVKLLINSGSDPEIRNNEHNTPLCKAVLYNNLDIVNYLIAKKVKINIVGGKYGGPLHIACRMCDLELVKILVDAGADVDLIGSSAAGTPIQSACQCWDPYEKEMQESIIRYLVNEAKADVTTIGGPQGCALNAACGWSTPDIVKLILEKGSKIDVENELGRVAIHFAATKSLEHFQLILEAGADVEARDKMGRTALHWATMGGMIDIVKHILSLSSGLVDQADIDGWTPLLWAARGCGTYHRPLEPDVQEEIIKSLLDRGANLCVRGKVLDQEWSPVRVARYHGVDDATVQLLITKAKEKLAAEGDEDSWDEAFHASKKGLKQTVYCDSCLLVRILRCPFTSSPSNPEPLPLAQNTPLSPAL